MLLHKNNRRKLNIIWAIVSFIVLAGMVLLYIPALLV